VPAGATVVGVPGRIVRINGRKLEPRPRDILDHAQLPDPVVETLRCMVDRIEVLEQQMRDMTKTTRVDWNEEVPVECAWLDREERMGW
jgi:serine O-acetyltransferase